MTRTIKKFFVNNFKSYPYDQNLYLFKGGLINKIIATPLEKLVELKQSVNKQLKINNIKELTINYDRKLILAAIKLYNKLTLFFKNDKAR